MDEFVAAQRKALLQKAAEELQRNDFKVSIAKDGADAVARVLEIVKPGETVAFGGSKTVKTLDIDGHLERRGQPLLAQKSGMTTDEVAALRRKSLAADVFLGSPNAVTLDGNLVFVDKIGNRAAGMMFGPKTVIAIAGYNKIVADEAAARQRIDTFAAPANAKRLKTQTPCAATGECADCASPQRICNVAVTLWKRPAYTDYHVILVPEELGY